MPVTFDERGRVIKNARPRFRRSGLEGLADYSFGANVWEILHPEQVQAEYTAVGVTPPSKLAITMGYYADRQGNVLPYTVADVASDLVGNVGRSADATVEAAGQVGDALGQAADTLKAAAPWLLIGLGLIVALEVHRRYGRG